MVMVGKLNQVPLLRCSKSVTAKFMVLLSFMKSLNLTVAQAPLHKELDGLNMEVLLDTLLSDKDQFSGVLITLINFGSKPLVKEEKM